MAIHSGNYYLSLSQMTDNAQYILDTLVKKGWTKNAVCGMLGNMQRESTINPGIWQNLDEGNTSLGIGLCQWTPATKLINWANSNGLNYLEMDTQINRILWELENGEQYYSTDSYPESFSEFTNSTKSVTYLASCFLHNYERAGVSAESERQENATYWFNHLEVSSGTTPETSSFTPRLDSNGMEGEKYWYDGNPFYTAGYGLPNCTCYAWGRFWEISDLSDGTKDYSNTPSLPLGDAGTWYNEATSYERGQTPRLGAVACWSDTSGGAGHVAIVEKIESNGDITVSQSGYGGDYFWTNVKYKADGYNYTGRVFQGFIYNPHVTTGGNTPEVPSGPTTILFNKKQGFNFITMNRRRRVNQNGQRGIII